MMENRTPDHNPRQRATDKGKIRSMYYHFGGDRLWLFAITVAVAFAIIGDRQNVSDIQQGRQATAGIVCEAVSGGIDAGRAIVTGKLSPKPTQAQLDALAKAGYPSQQIRDQQARVTATKYAQIISKRVQKQLVKNGTPKKIAAQIRKKDGTLNCEVLSKLGKIK